MSESFRSIAEIIILIGAGIFALMLMVFGIVFAIGAVMERDRYLSGLTAILAIAFLVGGWGMLQLVFQ